MQPNVSDIVTRQVGNGTVTDITTIIINDLTNTSVKTQSSFATGPRLEATQHLNPKDNLLEISRGTATQAESQNFFTERWEQLEAVRGVDAIIGNRKQRQIILNTTYREFEQNGILPAFRAAWFYHLAVLTAEIQKSRFKNAASLSDRDALTWEARESVKDHIALMYIAAYYWTLCLQQKEKEIRFEGGKEKKNVNEQRSRSTRVLLEKLTKEREMFVLVVNRLNGRIYWLMLIHDLKSVGICVELETAQKKKEDKNADSFFLKGANPNGKGGRTKASGNDKDIKTILFFTDIQKEFNQREPSRIQLPKNGYNFVNGAVTPTSLGLEVLDPLTRRQYLPFLHQKSEESSSEPPKRRSPDAPKFEEIGMTDANDRREGEAAPRASASGKALTHGSSNGNSNAMADEGRQAGAFTPRGFGDAEIDLELFEKVVEKLITLCRFREVHELVQEVIQFHLDLHECVLLQEKQHKRAAAPSGVRQWVRDILDMLHMLFFIADPALDRLSLKHVTSALFIGREVVLATPWNTLISANVNGVLVEQTPILRNASTWKPPNNTKFLVVDADNGKIALKCSNGTYLRAANDQRTIDQAKVDTVGKFVIGKLQPSCHFTIEDLGHGLSAIATQSQTYIFAHDSSTQVYQSGSATSFQPAWIHGRLTIRMAEDPRPGQLFSPVPTFDAQKSNNPQNRAGDDDDDTWAGLSVIDQFVDINWLTNNPNGMRLCLLWVLELLFSFLLLCTFY